MTPCSEHLALQEDQNEEEFKFDNPMKGDPIQIAVESSRYVVPSEDGLYSRQEMACMLRVRASAARLMARYRPVDQVSNLNDFADECLVMWGKITNTTQEQWNHIPHSILIGSLLVAD